MAKKISDKVRRQRHRNALLAGIDAAWQTACESHTKNENDGVDAALERIRGYIGQLLRPKPNKHRRKRFIEAFKACMNDVDAVIGMEPNGDMHIDGFFDPDKLYRHFEIVDVKPELKVINGGENGEEE